MRDKSNVATLDDLDELVGDLRAELVAALRAAKTRTRLSNAVTVYDLCDVADALESKGAGGDSDR